MVIPDEQMSRLDKVSQVDLGSPYDLLCGPQGQMAYSNLEPSIELPRTAPYRRWRWAGTTITLAAARPAAQ